MIKVLPKIMQLLELFASGQVYSFAEITERTGLNISNVAHLLQTLCQENMVEKISHGTYRRGPRLLSLCNHSNPWQDLLEKASRCADLLSTQLNELAVIGVRNEGQRLTLVKRMPEKMLQVNPENQRHYAAGWYCTANGRIMLAYAPDTIVLQVVRQIGIPEKKVWKEATSLPKLMKELEKIRQQGFVVMDVDSDIRAIGIPAADASGEKLLSVATAFPVFSCRKSTEDILAILHTRAACFENELKISGILIADLIKNMQTFQMETTNHRRKHERID